MERNQGFLNQLSDFKDKQIIKVITGLRRCGKSTLMNQYAQTLLASGVSNNQIIYINLDDLENENLLDYHNLHSYIKERLLPDKMNYVFIDEVQLCKDFQKTIESIYNKKYCDVYLTGSNAEILSGELASYLSGRYITIELQPFSFSEYLLCAKENHFKEQSIEKSYRDYVRFGSMPFTLQLNRNQENINQYLNGVYNTVLVKDVATRHQINDISVLESVIKYIFQNCGNICTSKKISDTLNSSGRKTSQPTVENYMRYLEECFLVYAVSRYDVRGKEILKTLSKYYIADTGLRNMLLGYRNIDTGHILENLVYLELRRLKYKVFTGKNAENEIDFVALKADKTLYIQVSETVKDSETLKRELKAFNNIKDAYPRILITLDDSPNADYNGVRNINALDFLTGKVEL